MKNYFDLINGWIDGYIEYTATGCMLLGIDSKDDLIQERIAEFNKYFSKMSEKLYGESFVLSSDKHERGYKLKITSISGNRVMAIYEDRPLHRSPRGCTTANGDRHAQLVLWARRTAWRDYAPGQTAPAGSRSGSGKRFERSACA